MIRLYSVGYVGNLGTSVLIEKKQADLIKYFNYEFIAQVQSELDTSLSKGGLSPSLIMPDNNVVDAEEIGKGGILTALWKICDRNKWGLRYSLKKIPILQGTIEIANYFDINPYKLLTKNSFLIATEDGDEKRNCDTMSDECYFRFGENIEVMAEIGEVVKGKKRVRIDGESEAFLTKDFKDEIDKILINYTRKMYD